MRPFPSVGVVAHAGLDVGCRVGVVRGRVACVVAGVTQHEHREKLVARPLPADESLRSEPHRDGFLHVAYPTATMTLCGRAREGASSRSLPTCVPCGKVAAVYFRIDRSAPAGWFKTSGGAAIPSPVAPPEELDAA